MPEPNVIDFGMAIGKLKSYKSPGIDQIPAVLFKAGVEQLAMRSINLLFLFGIRRNCRRRGRSRSFYLFIRRVMQRIVVIIEAYHFFKYVRNFIQHPADKDNFICRGNYWGLSV